MLGHPWLPTQSPKPSIQHPKLTTSQPLPSKSTEPYGPPCVDTRIQKTAHDLAILQSHDFRGIILRLMQGVFVSTVGKQNWRKLQVALLNPLETIIEAHDASPAKPQSLLSLEDSKNTWPHPQMGRIYVVPLKFQDQLCNL